MGNASITTHEGFVELFTLNLTPWTAGIIRVCNSRINKDTLLSEAVVVYSGETYITLPFETANFKRGGERAEKPKLVIPDGSMDFWLQLLAIGGAPGARIERLVMRAADILADEAPLHVDRYVLDKPSWDGGKLTFELSAPHAFRKQKFPAKQMMRDEYPGLGEQLLR